MKPDDKNSSLDNAEEPLRYDVFKHIRDADGYSTGCAIVGAVTILIVSVITLAFFITH